MFGMYDQRFRDILLLILGFFGAFWFFLDFGNHHPLSGLNVKLNSEEAIEKADSTFYNWQYQPVNLKKRARVISYADLVNDLQEKFGRAKFITNMNGPNGPKLPLYNWKVEEFSVDDDQIDNAFSFNISQEGRVVSFQVNTNLITRQTPFNRNMIRNTFVQNQKLSKSREDSVISMLVDFQHMRTSDYDFFQNPVVEGMTPGNVNEFVWRGVDYYLQSSFWRNFNFSKDSLEFNDDGQVRYVTAFLTSRDTVMGIVPKLEIELLPAGVLRKLSVDLGDSDQIRAERINRLRNNITLGVMLVFVIWLLISFYLRIKARAIDTRPALVVAIICGFLIPVLMLLQFSKSFAVTLDTEQISSLFNRVFEFGVFGAITATAFFVITAVSDSVTRQYWPEQLKTWDLVRRGMFKNKPVGWSIIRAICIGAISAGAFVLLMSLFSDVYISGSVSFIDGNYVFAPLANIIITLLVGLAFIVLCFLIMGNQVYGMTSKKWIIPVLSGGLVALMDPMLITMAPEGQEIILNFGIGFLIGLFYISFDFVTVALGFFIFLNFLSTSKGWIVTNSPDSPIFFGFVITLILLGVISMYFILMGEDKDQLPEYVPEYIEDLAKEQRVKQELDIALNVQKTFLPNTTPEVPGFDTAAICEPAQETGGDYYDIICLDDHRAAVAIGDVSGKGIQAAFYMTFVKGVIHSLCTIFPSPKTMLYRANKLFNQNATRGTFISMIYGILDSEQQTFTYVRAGHNPILYKKTSGDLEWLQPKGVAIGMTKGDAFNKVVEEETLELSKGDVLLLYTDGLTEAQNTNEEFYNEKRLFKLLKREKTGSAQELRNLIIEDVRTFIGDALQYDDMTLVVIKV